MLRSRNLLGLLLSLAAAACTAPTDSEIGGVYYAMLQSQGGEGGAVIELVGPGIESVRPQPGSVLAMRTAGDTVRLLILADPRRTAALPAISFELTMAAGRAVPQAEVLQVIGTNSALRPYAASYSVHFSR